MLQICCWEDNRWYMVVGGSHSNIVLHSQSSSLPNNRTSAYTNIVCRRPCQASGYEIWNNGVRNNSTVFQGNLSNKLLVYKIEMYLIFRANNFGIPEYYKYWIILEIIFWVSIFNFVLRYQHHFFK